MQIICGVIIGSSVCPSLLPFDEVKREIQSAPSGERSDLCLWENLLVPLPNIIAGNTARCAAKCKRRGSRCWNPAAFGMPVCRYHGSHKQTNAKTPEQHWNYKHGRETKKSKADRSAMLAELRELEAASFVLGIASGSRWAGRKPSL